VFEEQGVNAYYRTSSSMKTRSRARNCVRAGEEALEAQHARARATPVEVILLSRNTATPACGS